MSASKPGRAAREAMATMRGAADGPVFPTAWAARAFALAVALNERGLFTWSELSAMLGPKVAASAIADAMDPEAYWQAWLAALEDILARKDVAGRADLVDLQEAWRRAARATPHGEPIVLGREGS